MFIQTHTNKIHKMANVNQIKKRNVSANQLRLVLINS